MILAAATYLISIAFGISAVVAMRAAREKITTILIGTIAGLSLFTTGTYVLSIIFPITPLFLAGELMVIGLVTISLIYRHAWPRWQRLELDRTALGVLFTLSLLFSFIAPKLLIMREGELRTGIINAYGDITWHVANITTFEEGQTIPPEHPSFAGRRLTYPFLSNYFSAITRWGGASLTASVTTPALILLPVLLTLFYCLARDYSNGNKQAALIAMILFMFAGATLGWTRFGDDLQASNLSLTQFLLHLPSQDYAGDSNNTGGFHFTNPITTLLLPQRSFLFGMPLALAVLLLVRPSRPGTHWRYIAAGTLAGLLPLFHAHTTLALIPAIAALAFIHPGRHWLFFAIPTIVIGAPEVLYYIQGSYEAESFFRYSPGWTAGDMNLFWFWLKNTGLLVPITIVVLITRAPRAAKALAVAGLILFIAGNVFLFARWEWDNIKLLIWWLLFSLPAIGWLATRYLSRSYPLIVRGSTIVLIGMHILSGGLDMWKIALPTSQTWVVWDQNSIAMAKKITEATKLGESIVTAPTFNSTVALAGRPRYLGYSAHVWSHGISPWEREKAVQQLYTGKSPTLPDPQPDYVLVGPQERAQYRQIVTQPKWSLVIQEGQYALYKLQ